MGRALKLATVGLKTEIAALLRLQMAAGIVWVTPPPRATHKLVEVRLTYWGQSVMAFAFVVVVVVMVVAVIALRLKRCC